MYVYYIPIAILSHPVREYGAHHDDGGGVSDERVVLYTSNMM